MASHPTPDAQTTPPGLLPDASIPQAPNGPTGYPPYTPYTPYMPYPDAGYAPYPYPPAPGYYPWAFAPPAPRMSTWAIVGMICGIVSIASFQPIIAGLAIVFSFIGLNEVKKSAGQVEGRGMGIAGVVTGFIAIGIFLLFIALYILYIVVLISTFSTMPG